jgi:hypothetical protein
MNSKELELEDVFWQSGDHFGNRRARFTLVEFWLPLTVRSGFIEDGKGCGKGSSAGKIFNSHRRASGAPS